MKKIFLLCILFLFLTTNLFAEYRLEPVNCTIKKKDNCGAYLYNSKTGSTYFCNSTKCTEILEALQEPLIGIVDAVKNALEKTPPELGSDVAEQGLVLTGGGAMLKSLDTLLMEECGVPVIIAEDPLTCVARGGGKYLEMIDEYGLDILTLD